MLFITYIRQFTNINTLSLSELCSLYSPKNGAQEKTRVDVEIYTYQKDQIYPLRPVPDFSLF